GRTACARRVGRTLCAPTGRMTERMDRWLEDFARTAFRRSSDTAHDLKTPLNVAVLNVELLRMRIAKLAGAAADDEKILAYTRAIETELRRMAQIFDVFFLLSTPPKGEEERAAVDLSAVCAEASASIGINLELPKRTAAESPPNRIVIRSFSGFPFHWVNDEKSVDRRR